MAKDWFLLPPVNVIKQLANRIPFFKYCCRQPSDRVFQQYQWKPDNRTRFLCERGEARGWGAQEVDCQTHARTRSWS